MTGTARPRTVFVTGAAGFIGSALCRRLLEDGCRVVGYDDLSRGSRQYLPAGVSLVVGDIRDRDRLRDAVGSSGAEWIVHLAAMHFIPDCLARPDEARSVNVGGTSTVLDACRRTPSIARVLFASTAAIYAPSDAPCAEETTPPGPLEVYGETKLEGERLAAAFHIQTGIGTAVLRLFNAIGPNETNPHVIPHIFESLRRSDVVPLGDLRPRRDYIDTRDVADAVLATAALPDGFHVFNVGTGAAHSVADVVASLRQLLDRDIVIVQDPARLRATDRALLVADIGRIRRTAGWQPAVPFEDSLRALARSYGLLSEENFSG